MGNYNQTCIKDGKKCDTNGGQVETKEHDGTTTIEYRCSRCNQFSADNS